MRTAILSAIMLAAAQGASAQAVMPCDWQASAQSVVEPWEDNSRTFANGEVRLAFLDTIEPAVGWAYLLVLSPPYDELGGRQCRVVGFSEGMGFAGLDFPSLLAGYDPALGLQFEIVVDVYDPETGDTVNRFLYLTVNQATGDVFADLAADNE